MCASCIVSGGPPSDPGRLSSSDVSANITVLANNYPYGVFEFANGSRRVDVAEDFNSQSPDNTVSLLVQRTAGAADYSQVNQCFAEIIITAVVLFISSS